MYVFSMYVWQIHQAIHLANSSFMYTGIITIQVSFGSKNFFFKVFIIQGQFLIGKSFMNDLDL